VWHLYVKQQTRYESRYFFKFLPVKKVDELAVTSNKLSNNLAGLVASGLWPDVARRLPVGPSGQSESS